MRINVAAFAVLAVVVTAGCAGALLGEDLDFESGETVIEESTAQDAGYELQLSEREEYSQTIDVGDDGNQTNVTVKSHMARYGQVDDDMPAGTGPVQVGTVTIPEATIAGQSVNPLLQMDTYELAARYVGGFDESGFEEHDDYTLQPFDDGSDANVTVFRVEPDEPDAEPTAFIHVLQTQRDDTGDTIIGYVMYPVDEAESETAERLLGALEYTPPEELEDSDAEAENEAGDE